jgi:predicted dehydrogenase
VTGEDGLRAVEVVAAAYESARAGAAVAIDRAG